MIKHNNQEYKVVVVTPAGREEYLLILRKYIEREMNKGIIDGWQLWQNTDIQSDIDYMEKISLENSKIGIRKIHNGKYDPFKINSFFVFAQESDTIYLRLDDDIVFIEDNAIENLLKCRIDNSNAFIVCANIVNNTILNCVHQEIGALSEEAGKCSPIKLDSLGISDNKFAETVHLSFIVKKNNGTISEYIFKDKLLSKYEEFSVNCFAFWGRDKLIPPPDEETAISSSIPASFSRPNIICGNALVVHFAYHTQREFLNTKPYYYNYYLGESKKI